VFTFDRIPHFVSQTQGNGGIEGALHHLQTDADGAVQFTLSQPVLDVLTVNAYPQTEKQAEKWYPTMVKGETAVVVQKGIQSKGRDVASYVSTTCSGMCRVFTVTEAPKPM
jgi:hypothetical protein